mmetsp:Transcript_8552/g.17336  ORF Transcript_8552/g.17336 Transcript_8552/m.17336 type:complete len:254 (-) Transcript_8552:1274-2035(-)
MPAFIFFSGFCSQRVSTDFISSSHWQAGLKDERGKRCRLRAASATARSSVFHHVNPVWSLEIHPNFDFSKEITANKFWALVLAGDSNIARQLRAITRGPVIVDTLEDTVLDDETDINAPSEVSVLDSPLRRRQIIFRDQPGTPLVYAASWWNATFYDSVIADNPNIPPWEAFDVLRISSSREVQQLTYGSCPSLEPIFGQSDPFWTRLYVFRQRRKSVLVIYEVLSQTLEPYIGRMTEPSTLSRRIDPDMKQI